MSKVLKVAIVGAGRAGSAHAANVARNAEKMELVAIVDEDVRAAERLRGELSVRCAAVTPAGFWTRQAADAVIVTVPTPAHAEIVCRAAGAGLHILCEKPLAVTLEQARAVREAVGRAGVVFQLGFMRRFDPDFLRAWGALRAGQVGSLMMMRSVGRGPFLPPRWAYDSAVANGLLAEVNSHDFDSVRWFSGSEVHRVAAYAGRRVLPELPAPPPDSYNNAVVFLETENGVLAVVESSCPVGYGYDSRVELLGERGLIWAGKAWAEGYGCITRETPAPPAYPGWRERYAQAFAAELEAFGDAVAGAPLRGAGVNDGIRVLEIVLAVRRSLRTGEPVAVRAAGCADPGP